MAKKAAKPEKTQMPQAPAPKEAPAPNLVSVPKTKENPKTREKQDRDMLEVRPFMRIGSLMPKGMRAYFEEKLAYAGVREDARVWAGIRILLAVTFAGLLLFIYLMFVNPVPTLENIIMALGFFFACILFCLALVFLGLYFAISDRASAMEKVLPDFLLLTVSNLRAGMTPFSSFVKAARPEFGALHREVMVSAAKASGSASLTEALRGMEDYFDSKIFKRTITLFAKGIQSGGQLATLLHSSADEVQHIQDLRAELSTSTRTYTMFLGFITVIVMPFLLSISTLFVDIFVKLQPTGGENSAEMTAGIPTFSGHIKILPEEMRMISIMTLVMTSLMVSALSGIISKGKPIYGIKNFPLFAIASIIMFFLAYATIGTMLIGFQS